ncbi:MAG: CBS domain-containing protein [Gammaproteobacteria bacterium]|nr:CBS domain-containing protein [Gammaproteobacteria bacterium]
MNDKKRFCVRDVMKAKYDMVDGMTTVSEALNKMKYIETKSLIVDKRDEDDEYGMVMLADIARQVLAQDRSPERINIYEVMSKPVLTVHPDMDIRYCARLFDRFGLSRAPVVSGNHIIGIVSLTDMVLKGMCNEDE